MAVYVSIPIIVAAALFQSAAPQAGPASGLKPDLVMVFVAVAGMQLSFRQAIVVACVGGVVLDIYSGMPLGMTTILMILVAGLSRLPNRDLVEMNPLACMLVVAVSTLLIYVTYLLALISLGGTLDWFRVLTTALLPTMVANSLISPLVFVLFKLLRRRILAVREDFR